MCEDGATGVIESEVQREIWREAVKRERVLLFPPKVKTKMEIIVKETQAIRVREMLAKEFNWFSSGEDVLYPDKGRAKRNA